MRIAAVLLLAGLTCCTTPVPVHWDVHKQAAPKIAIPDPEFASGSPSAGREAFVSAGCIDCHRVADDPSLPAGSAPTESVLRDLKRFPPNQLAQRITSANTGGRTMKLTSQPLTTKQLVDIVAYLRSRG